MKADSVEISRVQNGYIVKVFDFERNEDMASLLFVALTLGEALAKAEEALTDGKCLKSGMVL
jgi:hypothetical protein